MHRSMHLRLGIGAVLLLVVGGAQPAFAAVITVNTNADESNTDGDCSLREALISASNDGSTSSDDACTSGSGPDTINVPAAIFNLSNGPLVVESDVTLDGAGAASTVVDGGGTNLVIQAGSPGQVIRDMTIQNGAGNGTSGAGVRLIGPLTLNAVTITNNDVGAGGTGGGIFNPNVGVLTITNSLISGNVGTGIHNQGQLTITDSTVSQNTPSAGGDRGGIENVGTGNATIDGSAISGNSGPGITSLAPLTVTDSMISSNAAGPGGFGGGINILAPVTTVLNGVTVMDNTASSGGGGGISNETGDLAIADSTIAGNQAESAGGISNGGSMTIDRSTISGNDATAPPDQGFGGGITIGGGTSILRNTTISGNTATCCGGGIQIFSGAVTLISTTVSGNSSSTFTGGIQSGGTLNLGNTILANNNGGSGGFNDCASANPVNSSGYNLIEDLGGCNIMGETTGNKTGADPQLGPLSDNGGLTQTMAPTVGAPVIDAGCAFGLTTDQRGEQRPAEFPARANVGDGADIGAVEVQNAGSLLGGVCPPQPPGEGGDGPSSAPLASQAFGARTLVTLSLARRRIPATGPAEVAVRNQNGFGVSGRLSGRSLRRIATTSARRRIKLRARRFNVSAQSRRTVKLTLPRALRRVLRRRRSLALGVTASVRDPAGNTRTVTRRLVLKLRKKPGRGG